MTPTLPSLEHQLVDAAHRRARHRALARRPWGLAAALAALTIGGGAVATATGVFDITSGTDAAGHRYVIQRPATPIPHAPTGSVCLQLRPGHHQPAYGCGKAPTASRPFGLVVADSPGGSRERVIYGLVSADVTRVSVLGRGTAHTDGATTVKDGLPGRFFRITVPNRGRIELVAYTSDGRERARIGSRATPSHPPRSHQEASARGDPSGFAPGISAPEIAHYRGRLVPVNELLREYPNLSCDQTRDSLTCTDKRNAP